MCRPGYRLATPLFGMSRGLAFLVYDIDFEIWFSKLITISVIPLLYTLNYFSKKCKVLLTIVLHCSPSPAFIFYPLTNMTGIKCMQFLIYNYFIIHTIHLQYSSF